MLTVTVAEFSTQHRVRAKRDRCGDPVLAGRYGHLYAHGDGWFGMVLETPADSTRLDKKLRSRKRRAIVAGFRVHQEGDCEAILLFDPNDPEQARRAIRLVGAKRKRVATPRQRAVLERARAASRWARRAFISPEPPGRRPSPAVGTTQQAAAPLEPPGSARPAEMR